VNCEAARLAIGADPKGSTAELAAHLESCAACAQFRAEMLALEGNIERALQRPPEGRARRRPAPARAWRPLALAASVLIATVAVLGVWVLRPPDTLAHELVAHVQAEPESWLAANQVSAQGIAQALAGAGVGLKVTSDRITYAQSCWFHGHYVPHLVVQTAQGPATVLILRHEQVSGRESFNADGLSGLIVPAQTGSIAVLARGRDGNLGLVAQQMQADMRWLPEPPAK